jgi:hypothetical protein
MARSPAGAAGSDVRGGFQFVILFGDPLHVCGVVPAASAKWRYVVDVPAWARTTFISCCWAGVFRTKCPNLLSIAFYFCQRCGRQQGC